LATVKSVFSPADIVAMRIKHLVLYGGAIFIIGLASAEAAFAQTLKPEMAAQFAQKTGLTQVEIPGTHGAYMVGSPFDRLLSEYLGQPITIAIVLAHKKPNAPRLDVLSDRARVVPEDKLQRRDKIGGNAGYVYADNADFASRIAGNDALMKRLKNLRYEYIRLDEDTVTFFFSGTELDYSGLIRDHGDYFKMLNDLMDDLADIADAVPVER
jgi:hypothetical protein